MTSGASGEWPLLFQPAKVSVKVSPRLRRRWSPRSLASNAWPRRMVLTAVSGERPSWPSTPVVLLTWIVTASAGCDGAAPSDDANTAAMMKIAAGELRRNIGFMRATSLTDTGDGGRVGSGGFCDRGVPT